MRIENGLSAGMSPDADWNLYEGNGERHTRKSVKFSQPFTAPPRVAASLYYIDILDGQSHRLMIDVEDVEIHGFTVVFKTWEGTRVYGAGVSWIAYGD